MVGHLIHPRRPRISLPATLHRICAYLHLTNAHNPPHLPSLLHPIPSHLTAFPDPPPQHTKPHDDPPVSHNRK